MEDKVSIIVPIFNVEQWLDECVQSIVMQTYKNIEIVLVDDGSTDNSGNICEEWKVKDKRVVVVQEKWWIIVGKKCGVRRLHRRLCKFCR